MQEARSVQELTALLVEPSLTQAKIITAQLIKQGVAHVDRVEGGGEALIAYIRSQSWQRSVPC